MLLIFILVDLRSFRLLRTIGKDNICKVRIVEKIQERNLHVLKIFSKQALADYLATTGVIMERNLLELFDHPLIVSLQYAFQDENNLYMVMPLMQGGDLRFHLQKRSIRVSEELIRCYAAEVICALRYLHGKGLMHRDIRPENLLLDQEGHIHLCNFKSAILLPKDQRAILKERAGTITYMPPESLFQTGYRESFDYWSLGIVLFELMFGLPPYRGQSLKEQQDIIESCCGLPIPMEMSDVYSPVCMEFIQGLLQKDPQLRLSSGLHGKPAAHQHPFLADLDWCAVREKRLDLPWHPSSKELHFDGRFALEDVRQERSLRVRRKQTLQRNYEHPEFVRMHRHFRALNTNDLTMRKTFLSDLEWSQYAKNIFFELYEKGSLSTGIDTSTQ